MNAYREADQLPEPEILESPDGDPRKRGTITTAHEIQLTVRDLHPQPPPPDYPYARDALVIAAPTTDLRVEHDLGSGLARLYEEERAARDARDALADYEPRRHP